MNDTKKNNLIAIMKRFILLLLLLISLINSIESIKYLQTNPIVIDEELDADYHIANVTQLIESVLVNTSDFNADLTRISSVKFSDLDDYFKLSIKEISLVSNQLIKSIDLKTGSKRIDRELVCATIIGQCLLNLNLIVQLDTIEFGIQIPIVITDLNDNKPSFYQPEIKIDIDLNNPSNLIKIPLKLAYDLDSTRENRIQNYKLQHSSKPQLIEHIQLKYTQRANKADSLTLLINSSDLNQHVNSTELFELKALDPNYEATQLIQIKFNKPISFNLFEKNFYNLTMQSNAIKVKLLKHSCEQIQFSALNTKFNNRQIKADFKLDDDYLQVFNLFKLSQFRLVAKCGDLNDSAFIILNDLANTTHNVNLVSAMNDLDITELKNNVFEFKFKSIDSVTTNSTFVTLAYLIAEQQQSETIKLKLNREINKLDDDYHDLIKIDEMRNGLYAFKLNTKYLDLIKKLNNHVMSSATSSSVLYELKLNILVGSETTIGRTLKLKLPAVHLINQINQSEETTHFKKSTTNVVTVTAATLLTNFNLFNSVVLITVISVVLILVALGCFIFSLTLYLKSKCKQSKEINKKDDLPEISVKLSEKKLYKLTDSIDLGSAESGISSGQASSSSSSSSSDISSNSSTITTATKNNKFNLLKTDFVDSIQTNWVNDAIMVYDVMPSKKQFNQSTHHSSSHGSSNISPITTTSGVDSAMSTSSTKQSLLQLSAKQLETDYESNSKDVLYKWYMNTTNDLIKPMPLKPDSVEKSDSSLNLNKEYRNEIYRNSHLIFKNAQYCQLKKSMPVVNKSDDVNFQTYEAKPINLINRENYSIATPSTHNSTNINSASSLDNYDTVNFDSLSSNSMQFNNRMNNRLSTAISIQTNSSENSSKSYVKTSLSMADSEQVSSV